MALIDKLTAIADAIRAKTGTVEEMTLTEMAEAVAGIQTGGGGGGSLFSSRASGTLPTVYKGTASSEFTLNFESSAVGALSE